MTRKAGITVGRWKRKGWEDMEKQDWERGEIYRTLM